jgi:flagellin-specific chaperone FliS
MSDKINNEIDKEVKGYIIPYDLPSENFLFLKNSKLVAKIRNERIRAIYYLHNLGVLATNSVILVPTSKVDKIDKVIDKVNEIYNSLNAEVKKELNKELGKPIIKKIPIVYSQFLSFKELAEKQLKEKLDNKIESLSKLLNEIENITDEEKRKRIAQNLYKTEREISELEKIAKELGLESNHKFSLISELIAQALKELEEVI